MKVVHPGEGGRGKTGGGGGGGGGRGRTGGGGGTGGGGAGGRGRSHTVYSSHHGSSHVINFYNREDPYYEFTNFHPCPIHINGELWPTTEHYFQAQKFVGTPYVDTIRRLSRPRDAFQLSRDPTISRWRRSDWETVKENVMLKALRAKFSDQHPRLRSMLLGTGNRTLVEHTSNDSYWGDGGDGSGSNRLGHLLMQVRSELPGTGPREDETVSATGWVTLDDSAITTGHRQGTYPPSGGSPLRRSNSFSSISRASGQSYSGVGSGYQPVGSELVTGGVPSYGRPSHPTTPRGGHTNSQYHHQSTGPSTYAGMVKKEARKVANGTKKATKKVKNEFKAMVNPPPSTNTQRPYNTRSSTGSSSVKYNIITNRSTKV